MKERMMEVLAAIIYEDKEKIPTKERSSFSLSRQRMAHVNWTANH
jgi:hypothetical protein